jgi:hypothetical protein
MVAITNETFGSGAASAVLVRQGAARIAVAGGLASLFCMVVLHAVKPELAPSSHVLSEYALGAHGWVMALCFLSLALGCAALLVALAPQATGVGGRIGLAFLFLAVVGLAMASMFPMDPITVPPDQATTSGKMHGVAAMLGVPGLVIAMLVLSYVLRKQPSWASVSTGLLAVTHATWIAMVIMFALVAVAMRAHGSGAGIGWANRVLMAGYQVWVVLVAWPLARAIRG